MKRKILTLLFLTAIICTNAFAQAVNQQDSLALVDLYNSTDGPNWYFNDGWLTGPVNTWTGIKVTGTRVTWIDLIGNNLKGSIPSSLGNLANLDVLALGSYAVAFEFNELSGNIPS